LLRQLSDSNLRDIPSNLPFRVEMWDREHIRWVIAASASVAPGMLRSVQRLRTIRVSGSRWATGRWSYGSISEVPHFCSSGGLAMLAAMRRASSRVRVA
jgi:hypothetical protein